MLLPRPFAPVVSLTKCPVVANILPPAKIQNGPRASLTVLSFPESRGIWSRAPEAGPSSVPGGLLAGTGTGRKATLLDRIPSISREVSLKWWERRLGFAAKVLWLF